MGRTVGARRNDTRHAARSMMWVAGTAVVASLLLGACASDGSSDGSPTTVKGSSGTSDSDTKSEAFTLSGPPNPDDVATPTIEGPITTGAGQAVVGPPKFDLSTVGYVQEEFFLSGTATSYTSDEPLSEDGKWDVTPDASAPYTTRIVVRRPADAADFDGTVITEWFNVSGGLDADPDWTYTHDEIVRAGAAWVGVSAQKVGIEGGGNSLGALLALKNADPVRYAPLNHPGDDFSYDMFSQAGAAVWFAPEKILGDLRPDVVLAMGESQSAFRLTTYVNAVAPLNDVYDGYLVHSRAGSAAPLAADAQPPLTTPDPTLSRTDLETPVLVFSSETDLAADGLGYVRARQPDSEFFAGWEVGGTAHADAYNLGIGDTDDGSIAFDTALFDAMLNPPQSVYFGVITCGSPINAGPHTYVVRSALNALMTWAREGTPPPAMPRLELDDSGNEFVRDANGNAVAGIRTPQLDAPVARLSGLGQDGDGFCGLFGTTVPFTADQLAAAYPDHETFVSEWNASLDAAVDSGGILAADAEHLRTVAQESTIGG